MAKRNVYREIKGKVNERKFLIGLRLQAEYASKFVLNPCWKRAYLALADAADRVDAMIARTEVKNG
jgi:hypothetical protein